MENNKEKAKDNKIKKSLEKVQDELSKFVNDPKANLYLKIAICGLLVAVVFMLKFKGDK